MKRNKFKLKTFFLNENEDIEDLEKTQTQFSREEKKKFLQRCKSLTSNSQAIYGIEGLDEKLEEIRDIVEMAEQMTLQETEDWFDGITVNRHIKQMQDAFKVFEKTGSEMVSMQQRLKSAYEDIVSVLHKYYDVG